MKNLIIIISIFSTQFMLSQVAIGKNEVEGSAILDFAENTNQGIILPWNTETSIQEAGSLVYSVSEGKVMFFDGAEWQDLSVKSGSTVTTEIDEFSEVGEGIIIGENSSQQGVLVLNDDTKAMVLPKSSEPWNQIKNPEAGTLVYDADAKLICIFNGTEWTFWGN